MAEHYGFTDIQTDEAVYGKGVKKGLPENMEDFYAHLARKVKAILFLSNKLDEDLKEKDQSDLFYQTTA